MEHVPWLQMPPQGSEVRLEAGSADAVPSVFLFVYLWWMLNFLWRVLTTVVKLGFLSLLFAADGHRASWAAAASSVTQSHWHFSTLNHLCASGVCLPPRGTVHLKANDNKLMIIERCLNKRALIQLALVETFPTQHVMWKQYLETNYYKWGALSVWLKQDLLITVFWIDVMCVCLN